MEQTSNFTLSQLEYFLATLKYGSFTAAADALGVSQPAVAEQIARLERVVGQSLFVRKTRGVTATRSAREFEPLARAVVDAASEVSTWITPADSSGESSVAIGTFASPHHYGLVELIAKFVESNPGSRLRVEGRNSSATADAVRAGELDAALVALPIDETGLDVRPIFRSEVFYVSADKTHTAKPVTIEDVCNRGFILYEASSHRQDPTQLQLEARAQARGLRIRPLVEVEVVETALDLAKRGIGDTYVAQILVPSLDPKLHIASFDPELIDTFALITRAGAKLAKPINDLVEYFSEHLVELANQAKSK